MGRHRYIERDIHGGKYLAGKIGRWVFKNEKNIKTQTDREYSSSLRPKK